MDPLIFFPPEIIHQIWCWLDPNDLLAARAVAPHWLASITDCSGAWVTGFSNDWTEFLAVKKAIKGWSSATIRKKTVKNVMDCLFTEFAFYLLYADSSLDMFSPRGDFVRTFYRPAFSIHRGNKCLLIRVKDIGVLSDPESILLAPSHTIITDFVMNHIDDLFNTEIEWSSENGYSFVQNGRKFLSLGPEFPATHRVPLTLEGKITFLSSCAVSLHGLIVKTVQFFNAETESSTELKTIRSSARRIPWVEIIPGPDDYFCIEVDQTDFRTIEVYRRNVLVYEDTGNTSIQCFFTKDYFIGSIEDNLKAYSLKDFNRYYRLRTDLPDARCLKPITCEPWSRVYDNFLVVFNETNQSQERPWTFYRLVNIKSADEGLKLELRILAEGSTGQISDNDWQLQYFEYCLGYAFGIENPSSITTGNKLLIQTLHLISE